MRRWMLILAVVLTVIPGAALYLDSRLGRVEASEIPAVQRPEPAAQAPVQVPQPPPPPPKPAWAKVSALEAAVKRSMEGFSGAYSVAVHDLTSGEQWALNPDQRYHPASTIKMPVTLYALEQFRAGKLGWQEYIEYTPADFESPGGGAFETAPFGGYYPVENLVGRALRYSNNVAVNMLGRRLGWENIRAWTRTIGGDLYREPDASPRVTVMSELGWWIHLETLSRTDPVNAKLLLEPLGDVAYEGRIAAGLPTGTKHLHKFGSYDGYFHDGGWVMGDRPFLMVVMTQGAREDEADAAIARVTAEIFKVMSE